MSKSRRIIRIYRTCLKGLAWTRPLHLDASRRQLCHSRTYVCTYVHIHNICIYTYIPLESRTSCSSKCNLLRRVRWFTTTTDRWPRPEEKHTNTNRESIAPPPSSSLHRVASRRVESHARSLARSHICMYVYTRSNAIRTIGGNAEEQIRRTWGSSRAHG